MLIHSADPASFWKPKDKNNERWLELKQKPNRYRNPELSLFESIIAEQHNVFENIQDYIYKRSPWLDGK